MKIISYNVNGIRAAIKKGLIDWLKIIDADVICFQELKANKEDIEESLFQELGYHCYWFSAQKKGYSGVGILSKKEATKIVFGNGMEQADFEGRTIQLTIDTTRIINTYFPSGSSGDERQEYKMQFLEDYLIFLNEQQQLFEHIVVAGDYNICHKAIDIHDPKGNKNSSGFLPEERAWMDEFFEAGFIDTFRCINPHPHQYSWWSYRANARQNNKGWRIDYINVNENLKSSIADAQLFPDAHHSDHCPIMISLKK